MASSCRVAASAGGHGLCVQPLSNSRRTAGSLLINARANVGVTGQVAVADEHGDVGREALRAKGRGRERCGHAEEDDGAAFRGGKDGAMFAAGYVDADDGDVRWCAERAGHRLG